MSWDLSTLFRRHAKDIARTLHRRGLTVETAADLTQDTFVRLLVSPPKEAAGVNNPVAYLFRIARNLRIDHQRRERVLKMVDLSDDEFAEITDQSPNAETIVYDRQRLELTKAALAELPDRTRRAFELHRLGELTIAETAATIGLSSTTTWTLLRDAYEHIDARLNRP
ncbi:sigma-70 family RNA polymerase sigma factor [Shinella curvata]|uniref:Sigma-70 family RNA polymerase sigma factor n=1 Tax=Shinella curvata TaxID=1817964 RepID=A0ABT8XDS1_9HYPH|nr:sigma-70 family RNA polymerase sigma factor [Shinella curvata]MCJ8055370.1 sigma-70 family RNA polymerase sigma factor [Shinella curvata]MDO6121787.1 sigma-70 family RNA polymerase sigma factor [Shinella curvata]